MRTLFTTLFFLILFFSCKKKDTPINQYENIPNVNVNLYLQLDQPAYFNLTAIGGYVYLEGGSKGIIVYRTADAYKAYERHSPHRSSEACSIVSVDSSNVYAVEGCDNIQYYLIDGTVATGNSTIPLLQYEARESQGSLHISN